MNRVLLCALAIIFISPVFVAWKKAPVPDPAANEIHWITSIDELQAKMQQNPKKVYFDIYTGWCGWCKKMDETTFRNPALVKYMNTNYYAVKLDAERQDVIHFQGKEYHFEPQYKANTFAVEIMKGSMSYPTAVIMMENFQNPQVQAGYMDVNQLETILTYFGDNAFKHQSGTDYQKTYKPRWANGQVADMTPPAGH